jgi:dTDP-4-dehydrorhamnose reductase
MKILITGAKGQLGKDFQRIFDEKQINYYAMGSNLNITKYDALKQYVSDKQISHIINCAAYNEVDKAEEDWETANAVNGSGVKNLAILANEANAVLIHYSTDYVFDGLKGEAYIITDKPKPISKYGKSKLLGEQFIQEIASKYFLIRTSWLFGAANENFVSKVLKWSQNNKELRIVNDQISNPTYTFDLAKASLDLIKTEKYGLYHITNTESCSRYEWARFILDLTQWEGKISSSLSSQFKTAAKRPFISVLDNSVVKEVIGYQLPDWQDATKRYLKEKKVI